MRNRQAIPAPFPWMNIEELAAFHKGAIKIGPFGSQLKRGELTRQGYKVYGQENVIADDFSIGDRYIGAPKFTSLRSCQLLPGDVVITMMGTIGHCAVFPMDAAVGIMDSHLLRIQVNLQITRPDYVALTVGAESVVGYQIARLSHGSIMSGLSSSIVKRLRIPVPPLSEQRRIAEILDTADEAIRQTQRVIAKLKDVKKGLLHDLLTRGLDEEGRLRDPVAQPEQFKDSVLGTIPRAWQVASLLDLAVGGISNGFFKKPELVGSGYRLINVLDLYQDFGIDVNLVQRVRASEREKTRYSVKPGDCFFTRSSLNLAGIAHCNVVRNLPEPALFECHLMRVQPDRRVVPAFFAHWCRSSNARSFFMARARQVTMTTITQIDIAPLLVPLPSVPEQSRVVEAVDAHDARIQAEEATLEKLRQVKRGLMDDLLTGRVRVVRKKRARRQENARRP